MTVHISFMPDVIQIVSRVHTFCLWLVQCAPFQRPSGPKISEPGGVQEGEGGKDSFPVNARGAVFRPGSPAPPLPPPQPQPPQQQPL